MKFDDLCTDFRHHEDLDFSESVVTVKKTDGTITDMVLSTKGNQPAGVVPVTVPTSEAKNMKVGERESQKENSTVENYVYSYFCF